jgi:hypothetical protein
VVLLLRWNVHHHQTGKVAEEHWGESAADPVDVVVCDQNGNETVGSVVRLEIAECEENYRNDTS